MRWIRLLGAVTAILLVAALTPAGAAAAPRVTIAPNAQLDNVGVVAFGQIQVQVRTECSGTFGQVSVFVTQSPPDNFFTANGSGFRPIVCDGRAHDNAVTVSSAVDFNVGRATATANLIQIGPTEQATDAREIKIEVL